MEQTLTRSNGQIYFGRKLPDGTVFEAVCGKRGTVWSYKGDIKLALREAVEKLLPIAKGILRSRMAILNACGIDREAAEELLKDVLEREHERDRLWQSVSSGTGGFLNVD